MLKKLSTYFLKFDQKLVSQKTAYVTETYIQFDNSQTEAQNNINTLTSSRKPKI